MQDTVDPETDAQIALVRLDVDVRRPVGDGLVDEQVDELDDRRVLDDLGEPGEIGLVVGLVGRGLHDLVDLAVDPEEPLDHLDDLTGRRDDGTHLGTGERPDVVDREDVRRIGHRDDELAVLPADGDGLVPAGERLADERGDRTVDRSLVEIDELQADLARERAHELGFGDGALLDEQSPQGLSAARLLHDRRVELGLREESLVDQQRAEWRSVRQNCTASHSARTLGVSALRVVRCIRISLSVPPRQGRRQARAAERAQGDFGQTSRRPESALR